MLEEQSRPVSRGPFDCTVSLPEHVGPLPALLSKQHQPPSALMAAAMWPSLPPGNGRRDEGLASLEGLGLLPGEGLLLAWPSPASSHWRGKVCSPLRDRFSTASGSWLSAFAVSSAHPSVSPLPYCFPKVVTSPHCLPRAKQPLLPPIIFCTL